MIRLKCESTSNQLIVFWTFIIAMLILIKVTLAVENESAHTLNEGSFTQTFILEDPSTGSKKTVSGVLDVDYMNVVLEGRIIDGSSPYTNVTWKEAVMNGSIYGGRNYSAKNPQLDKMPKICTNNHAMTPEGERCFGFYICPRYNETANDTYCCGSIHREYCCDEMTARKFYFHSLRVFVEPDNNPLVVAFLVIAIVSACIGLLVWVIYAYQRMRYIYKHKHLEQRTFGSRSSRSHNYSSTGGSRSHRPRFTISGIHEGGAPERPLPDHAKPGRVNYPKISRPRGIEL